MSVLFSCIPVVLAQNITPRPTIRSPQNAVRPTSTPTAIRNLELEVQRFVDMRVEALTDYSVIFSFHTNVTSNKRLYVWDIQAKRLVDTGEDAVQGSVVAPKHGRYILFLHDESLSGRDIDGDRVTTNNVLRMYHISSGQRVNFQLPARSATPRPDEERSKFEYFLQNDILVYSVSESAMNNSLERFAPWHVINMVDILYRIEGTPTPTPTPTPLFPTPTPTLAPGVTPSPTPTFTPIPTVPPEFRSNADINADGVVNHLDLLMFQYFWFQ